MCSVWDELAKYRKSLDLPPAGRLVIGGQKGNYPANQCVDLLHCLLAARTFTEVGKLDDLLTWEEDKLLAIA